MLLATLLGSAAALQSPADPQEQVTLLVNYLTRPSDEEVAWYDAVGATVKYRYDSIPTLAVTVDEDLIQAVTERPGVEFVEADSTWWINDLSNTWGVEYIGGAYTLADGLGGAGVKVGVIDTGLDYNHPDLAGLYQGGWDFVNNDADPFDDNFHGTHVTGTIAAQENGVGVVGVAPDVEIYALKGFNAAGSGQTSDLIAAVDWTTTNNMDVVNNSWGGGGSTTLEAAFDASRDAGVIHVCAAGNNFGWFGVSAPAKYSSTYAISAIDSSGRIAAFSDRGRQIDFAAPGVNVNSTNLGGGYRTADGTSMASPHAAGVVALVLAHGNLTDQDGDGVLFGEVRTRMAKVAIETGTPGKDDLYGWGIVNAPGSIVEPMKLQTSNLTAGQLATIGATGCTPGDSVAFLFAFGTGRLDAPQANTILSLRNGVTIIGQLPADASGNASLSFTIPNGFAGTTGYLQAVESTSNASSLLPVSIN